ncbi:uracil-xanthine permease family protein [Candidatus Poriferisocius sp.]|uniref:uracil-xanthine permease family protein n=1 Tax=Candidatus Poriferisocius sp. TaxID=3101276 RepID=UPI003B018732
MTSGSREQPIRFEPEESCPPPIALLAGFQGAVLLLAPTVLNTAIAIRSSGLDDSYLTWGVFSSMVICGGITALQALRLRFFGAGHIVLSWPAAMFIAIMVTTISAAGLETFASLMIVCSLVQVALAWWLPTLRRIVTPTVSGTVTMLIAISVLPIAFDSVENLPANAPRAAGPVIAGATLLVAVIAALRASGRWRLIAPFSSILAGCAVGAAFGVLDGDHIASAGWFGVPDVPALSIDLTPSKEFWALLPSFAILTLVLGLKTISDGVAIQQGSRRRPRAIDFRRIQGMVSVNGVGMALAGLAGTLPSMAISSYSLSLVKLTGVAARRVGVGVAITAFTLALFSKFTAVLLTIPGPVLGANLMLAMGMLFVSGCQTVLRDGLDSRRMLVVALAIALGLGLHRHHLTRVLFGEEYGELLGSGVTIGAIAAIAMTLLVEALSMRRSRLEVTLDTASIPVIDDFLARLASKLGWNEASTLRLRSAGEETLASLLAQDDDAEGSKRPRLNITARPQGTMVELEFVATTRQENIEDQLAFLAEEVAVPSVDDLSLRLLRFHASAVRHQKYHGVDIVTVQVESSG